MILRRMAALSIIEDLFRYNSWANERILQLGAGLEDDLLDQSREMGFGSLRNTLFHILAAEEIWLERWLNAPWRALPTDARGISLDEIARRLSQTAATRQQYLERERSKGWQQMCDFRDGRGISHCMRLDGLLLHVANHGIHHRAQALSYLKRFGRTVPGGLDYLFFRFARPHGKQEPATVEMMRQFGLEVETGHSEAVAWDRELVQRYFAYGDWANERLLEQIAPLDDAALDRSWGIGMDTIRKTALHLADAERWWLTNWLDGPMPYERTAESTSVVALRGLWQRIIAQRNQFLATQDDDSAQRIVTALVGRMSVRISVVESAVQLCGHGTHHRAQLINMLRHSGATVAGCDYLVWLRETQS